MAILRKMLALRKKLQDIQRRVLSFMHAPDPASRFFVLPTRDDYGHFKNDELSGSVSIPKFPPVVSVNTGAGERYYDELESCIESFKTSYEVTEQGSKSDATIRAIERRLQRLVPTAKTLLLHVYHLRLNGLECCWVTFTIQVKDQSGRITEPGAELLHGVIAEILFDAGNVFIRPEGLRDKIEDWVNEIEVDIETERKFSEHYFMQTTEKEKLLANVPKSFFKILSDEPGLMFRLLENQMLITLEKQIDSDDALRFAKVAFSILDSP